MKAADWCHRFALYATIMGTLAHALAPAWHHHVMVVPEGFQGEVNGSTCAGAHTCSGSHQHHDLPAEAHWDCAVCRWLLQSQHLAPIVEAPQYQERVGLAPVFSDCPTIVFEACYFGRAPPV